ncbi:diaminopimelate epimerase [Natronospora cellulosivora (SeqCode)]
MTLNFTKMHGAGNDFIIINNLSKNQKGFNCNDLSYLAKKLCNRNYGIGGDGIILVLPADYKKNDYQMRIFNSDGSEAEMCGNGIRCFAHYIMEKNLSEKNKFTIETKAGIIKTEMISYQENKSQVKVNMGIPEFKAKNIPVLIEEEDFISNYSLKIDEEIYKLNFVSMGNPHTIIFFDDLDEISIKELGPRIETHKIFPQKTNVEFIEIKDRNEINMKVWERGAGETLACGTGACASVVAGIKNTLLNEEVLVHLAGGDLFIEWSGKEVWMTGPAETVFEGKVKV